MTSVTTRSVTQSSKSRSPLRTEPACCPTAQDWASNSTHWPFAVSVRPRSCGATPWEKKFAPLSGTRRWHRRGFRGKAPMGLKLHYNPLSTFSRRVLIAFAEKQIPHELVFVDMAARKHRQQPYLSLNPYGRVPTLEEDDFIL